MSVEQLMQLGTWLLSDVRQAKKPIKTTMVTTILAKASSLTIDPAFTRWNKPIVRQRGELSNRKIGGPPVNTPGGLCSCLSHRFAGITALNAAAPVGVMQ